MNLFICEICGQAHIGSGKPEDCPFCGAKSNFIKLAEEAKPITSEKIEISDISKKNLEETLKLETRAHSIYSCMAQNSKDDNIKAMYRRLAKVELEHATVCTKLLKIEMFHNGSEGCSTQDLENFKKTIELESQATNLYKKFTQESTEEQLRKFFGALTLVEAGHIELVKTLL